MSNLLDKSSILLTPTAYDNGKILSVKPAPSLGSELITNGNFSDGTNSWTPNANAILTIDNNKLKVAISGASGYPGQIITTEIGKTYKVSANGFIGTSSRLALYNNADGQFRNLYSDGSFDFTITATSTSTQLRLYVFGNNTFGLWDSVSVKEVIDGDFDFTRNSSATRVNSEGLIEDMQILSGDLVSNGDFSQEGSELVTNGDFATDSDWTKQTSWSISGGAANYDFLSDAKYVRQTLLGGGFVAGKVYKINFEITSGTAYMYVNSNGGGLISLNTYSVGSYSIQVTASVNGSDLLIYGRNTSGTAFSIDNVSVKEVGPDWTITDSDANNYVEFVDGTARLKFLNTSPLTTLQSTAQYIGGKKYKLTVNVKEVVSGGVKIDAAGVQQTYNSVGIQESIIEPIGSSFISFYRATANVDITLNSVSLIEITEDTNLPRIDYTGGEGHWLFEPQSTNGLNYSEPTSSETIASGVTYESFNWGIGFTNCIKFGDNSQTRYRYFTGTIANSTEYTISAFVIMDDLSEPVLGTATDNGDLIFRVGGNSATTGNLPNVNMGNNIYRLSSVITSASSGGTTGLLKYAGQSNKGFRVVGFQLEESSFATSYIPTSGSTVTRLQDAAFGAGSSDLINSEEGVLYVEIASFISLNTTEPNRYITLTNGTSNQRIALLLGGNPNQLRAIAYSNTQSINLSFTTSLTDAKQFNKLAIKYKSGDYAFFLNGVKIGGSTESNIFTANTLNDLSFDVGGGTQKFRGKVKCVAVYKEALTDAELTCLTTI